MTIEQAGETQQGPMLEVVIEIPRGSFMKRGSTGQLDFISPLPCPFNYGSVEDYIGLEGDLLDAVVLGPHLRRGTRVTVQAFGAVSLTDRGMTDDKLKGDRAQAAAADPAVFQFLREVQGDSEFFSWSPWP